MAIKPPARPTIDASLRSRSKRWLGEPASPRNGGLQRKKRARLRQRQHQAGPVPRLGERSQAFSDGNEQSCNKRLSRAVIPNPAGRFSSRSGSASRGTSAATNGSNWLSREAGSLNLVIAESDRGRRFRGTRPTDVNMPVPITTIDSAIRDIYAANPDTVARTSFTWRAFLSQGITALQTAATAPHRAR